MESSIKRINMVDLLIIIASISLILLGLITSKTFTLLGLTIIIVNSGLKETNTIYSLLVTLFIFHGTYLIKNLPFEWSLLYYALSILIVGLILVRKLTGEKLKSFYRDKYLYLMLIILVWGSLSAVFSTNITQSFKNILSIFLVFVIFYIIPRYFYSKVEVVSLIEYIVIPLNLITTIIALMNTFAFLELFIIETSLFEWKIDSTIYTNPNPYGIVIMLTLLSTNLLFILDNKLSSKANKSTIKKLLLLSYPVLIMNLLLSGSRSALLGTMIAFIPIALRKKKQAIAIGSLGVVFLITSADSLLLFKKFKKATTSGRWEIWVYGFNNVIAKYPILGIGAGASNDHIGIFGGLSIHNSYLNLIMTLGFVGFMVWMFVLALYFYNAFKLGKDKYLYIFAMLGIMAFAFFESSLFGGMGMTMAVFWLLVMMVKVSNTI